MSEQTLSLLLEEIRILEQHNRELEAKIQELSNPSPSPIALSQLIQQLSSREEKKSKVNMDRVIDSVLEYAKLHFI